MSAAMDSFAAACRGTQVALAHASPAPARRRFTNGALAAALLEAETEARRAANRAFAESVRLRWYRNGWKTWRTG